MSKLDWSKAGLVSSDPARVVDVGDYGILPDHLSGQKGKAKKKKKKKKGKKKKYLPDYQVQSGTIRIGASIDNIENAVAAILKIKGSNIPKKLPRRSASGKILHEMQRIKPLK